VIQRQQMTMIRGLGTPPAKRKRALWVAAGILGAVVAFETSFWLRELIVAELIFAVVFFLLAVLIASFYLIGVACARVFDGTRRAYAFLWVQHDRIFGTVKMISRKTFVIVSMWFGALIFPMRLSPARIVPTTNNQGGPMAAVPRDPFIYAKYVTDGDQALSRPHTDMPQATDGEKIVAGRFQRLFDSDNMQTHGRTLKVVPKIHKTVN
jgi:hypothetical protein